MRQGFTIYLAPPEGEVSCKQLDELIRLHGHKVGIPSGTMVCVEGGAQS